MDLRKYGSLLNETYTKKEDREIWKTIVTKENGVRYECSNNGRFRRVGKVKTNYLKPYKGNCYENGNNRKHRVVIRVPINGKMKEINCRKVLAEKFIRELKPEEIVINKNGNCFDLNIKNLFITNHKELGKITGGTTRKTIKVEYIDSAGFHHTFQSIRKAAKELNISYETVSNICKRKVKNPKYNLSYKEVSNG